MFSQLGQRRVSWDTSGMLGYQGAPSYQAVPAVLHTEALPWTCSTRAVPAGWQRSCSSTKLPQSMLTRPPASARHTTACIIGSAVPAALPQLPDILASIVHAGHGRLLCRSRVPAHAGGFFHRPLAKHTGQQARSRPRRRGSQCCRWPCCCSCWADLAAGAARGGRAAAAWCCCEVGTEGCAGHAPAHECCDQLLQGLAQESRARAPGVELMHTMQHLWVERASCPCLLTHDPPQCCASLCIMKPGT